MSLIKSIAGIRGTIGGEPGDALTPFDLVNFSAAFATLIKRKNPGLERYTVVVGRDARLSGEMVESVVCGTLAACGIDVINSGLATTPTVEMAVVEAKANGGIIFTASHNPMNWNALKLLNEHGEFLSAADGALLQEFIKEGHFEFVSVEKLGKLSFRSFEQFHIESVLSYPLVETEAIYRRGFKVVLDAVNSVGGVVVPKLLEALGVQCITINCEPTGIFAHIAEPLPENLTELSAKVVSEGAHLGIAVDPDVDRLVLICENGEPFGEEYTLTAVADYILQHKKGDTVSNMSSSRALRDVTEAAGCKYSNSAVGELNVVEQMKKVNAVVGGEGNGGVIIPDLHYGRDSLIGIALFLSHLALAGCSTSELRKRYPDYFMSKNKIELSPEMDIDNLLLKVKESFAGNKISDIDGVKVDFESERSWVHLRKSNTEPLIRIFSEAPTKQEADNLAQSVLEMIESILNN